MQSLKNASDQKKRKVKRHSSQRMLSISPIAASESPRTSTKSSRVSQPSVPLWASSFENPGPEFEKFQKKVIPFEKKIQEAIASSDIFEGFDTLIKLVALKPNANQYQDFVGTLQKWLSEHPGKVQDGNPNLNFFDFMHVTSKWFICNFEQKHWTEEVQSDSRDLLFEELKARIAPNEQFLKKYMNEFHLFEVLDKLIELCRLKPSKEQHQGFVKVLENWMKNKSLFQSNQIPEINFNDFMFIASKWFIAQRPELLRINPVHQFNPNNALLLVFAIAKDYMMLSNLGKNKYSEKLDEITEIISRMIQKESCEQIGINEHMICTEIKKLCGIIKKLDKRCTSFIKESSKFYKKQLKLLQDETANNPNQSKSSGKRKLSESKKEKSYNDKKNSEDSRRIGKKNSKLDLDKTQKSNRKTDKKKESFSQSKIKQNTGESVKRENYRKNNISGYSNMDQSNKRASADERFKIDFLTERPEKQNSKENLIGHKSTRRIKSQNNELSFSRREKLLTLNGNTKIDKKTKKNRLLPSGKKNKILEESKSTDKKTKNNKVSESFKTKNSEENKFEVIKNKIKNKINRKNSTAKISKLPTIQDTQTQTHNENLEVSNHNNNVQDLLTDESKIELSSIKEEIVSYTSPVDTSKYELSSVKEEIVSYTSPVDTSKYELSSVKEEIVNQVAHYEELSFSNNTFLRSRSENSIEKNMNRLTFTENLNQNPNPFAISAPATEMEIDSHSTSKSNYPEFNNPFQYTGTDQEKQQIQVPRKEPVSNQTVHVFTYQQEIPSYQPEKPKKNLELCQESIAEIPTSKKPLNEFEIVSSAMAEVLPNPLSIQTPSSPVNISPPKKLNPIEASISSAQSMKIHHVSTELDSNSSPTSGKDNTLPKDPIIKRNANRFNSMPNIGYGNLPGYSHIPKIPKHIYYVGSPTSSNLLYTANYQPSPMTKHELVNTPMPKIDTVHMTETVHEHLLPSPQMMNFNEQFGNQNQLKYFSYGNSLRPNFYQHSDSSIPKEPNSKKRNQVPMIYIESPRELTEQSSEEIGVNDSGVYYIQAALAQYKKQDIGEHAIEKMNNRPKHTHTKRTENEAFKKFGCFPKGSNHKQEASRQTVQNALLDNKHSFQMATKEILNAKADTEIKEDISGEIRSPTREFIKEEISASHSHDLNLSKEMNQKIPNDSYKEMNEIDRMESVDISTIPMSTSGMTESPPILNFWEFKDSLKIEHEAIHNEILSKKEIHTQITGKSSIECPQDLDEKRTNPELQKSQGGQSTNKQNQFNLKLPKISVNEKKKPNGELSAKQSMRKSSLPDNLECLGTDKLQLPESKINRKLSANHFEENFARNNPFLRSSMHNSEIERQKRLLQIIDTYKAMRDTQLKTKEEHEKVDSILAFYNQQLNKLNAYSSSQANLDSSKAIKPRIRSSSNADEVPISKSQRNSKNFVESLFDKFSGDKSFISLKDYERFCFEYKIASNSLPQSLVLYIFDQFKDSSSLLSKEAFVRCLHKIGECYFSRTYDIINLTNYSLLPISTKYSMLLEILGATITRKSSFG